MASASSNTKPPRATSAPSSMSGNAAAGAGAKSVPVHTVRHRRLKAAIWQNRVDSGIFHNVTVTRSYKVNDEWHETSSFGYDDLPIVAKLLLDCHTFITNLRARDSENGRG
ncbi:MAG: hypothetical protein SGJ19_05220 [Planctomycetia bacterium]|nr:hypothetical protein [Planctomycetia bacterium]